MKKIVFASALAVVLAASSAQAQVWTGIGTPDNVSAGSQFWDNTSDDGEFCNSGYILLGTASTSTCGSQRPTPWLPYSGVNPTTYLEAIGGGFQSFVFGAGSYSFSLLPGAGSPVIFGGDVAGNNENWGYYTYDVTGARTRTNLNSPITIPSDPTSILPISPPAFTGLWGLWIQLSNGSYAYSDSDNQFALFGFNAPGSRISSGNEWIAGMEDIFTGDCAVSASDCDYQDVLFKISGNGTPQEVVPEPATMTLLATGLAGMAAASRRRRKN